MSLPNFPAFSLNDDALAKLAETANKAADAAAEQTLRFFRQTISVENKDQDGGFDPVTAADRAAEQAIKEVIKEAFPEHGFYGEESAQVLASNQPIWVVDPIDGTRAFITGVPLWGTLIGVYDGQKAVLGVMDQPYIGERLVATNRVAHLHDRHGVQQIQTRKTCTLAESIVQTTAPDYFKSAYQKAVLSRVDKATSMVRYGGDCYCAALLAMGYIDLVVECDLQPYDIQAMVPIVRGAGGVISDWQGNPSFSGGSIVASANAQLHEQALALIAQN